MGNFLTTKQSPSVQVFLLCMCRFIIFPSVHTGTQIQNPEPSNGNRLAHDMTSASDEIVSGWEMCRMEQM